MATTKRTTANIARNIAGGKVRLLKTKLTADGGVNVLTYEEVRRAIANNDASVQTLVRLRGEDNYNAQRNFGVAYDAAYDFHCNDIDDQYDPSQTYFSIGCHTFTLKMFNRILRAAGVRTTKPQTLKAFGATA